MLATVAPRRVRRGSAHALDLGRVAYRRLVRQRPSYRIETTTATATTAAATAMPMPMRTACGVSTRWTAW